MGALRPLVLVELGTHAGVSYTAFCEAVRQCGLATRAYAVDAWTGDEHAGFYDDSVYHDFRRFHDQRYLAFSALLRMRFDAAVDRFEDGSIDLLHIDGLHTLDAVRHDWQTWLPKLSPRAVVLFHDTAEHQPGFGVWQLWRDLSERHPSFEFPHGHGLGVLCPGPQAPAAIRALTDERSPAAIAAIRERFAALGERHILARREEEFLQAHAEHDAALAEATRAAAAERAELVERLAAAERAATQAEQARAERAGREAELQAALANAAALTASVETERRTLIRRIEHLGRELSIACQSAEDERLRRAMAERQIAAAYIARDVVLQSTTWKLLYPVRRLAAAMPPGPRRQARRLARAAWWAATPWTLRRRLAQRRALRAALAAAAPPGPAIGPAGPDYQDWIAAHDTLSEHAVIDIRARLRALAVQPVISILMPVHDPDPAFLHAAIVSVRDQIYGRWELCIADDASRNPAVHEVLHRMAAEDARIKLVFRPACGHISQATNSALALAAGDFIGLLDHDDLLAPHALSCVVEALARHPDAGLVYSDEDKLDTEGRRTEPYFKSDWNYELFLSQNMISHFAVYRAALVRALGGLRPGFEGSQDHDLALRCIERLSPAQIVHVPRVLYHWRAHAGSTAHSVEAKPYARLAGQAAVGEHLRRIGVAASVELPDAGPYRVRYALPALPPLVSLVIPTRNALAVTRTCIESIRDKTTYPRFEIVLIDNGSDDADTLEWLAALPTIVPNLRLVRDERPFNYAALNNAGVAAAAGEVVCLLNNDIEVISPDWLEEMTAIALQPGVGAVGARLWFPDGTIQHAGVLLGAGGVANHAFKGIRRGDPGYFGRAVLMQNYSAVTAACIVIRRDRYLSVGGFDTALPVAFNDVDFCLRLLGAGLRNVWTPYAEMIHHESATRGDDDTAEKQVRFQREVALMHARWDDLLQADPAYNPNLTLKATDFSLAWPPRVRPLYQV